MTKLIATTTGVRGSSGGLDYVSLSEVGCIHSSLTDIFRRAFKKTYHASMAYNRISDGHVCFEPTEDLFWIWDSKNRSDYQLDFKTGKMWVAWK